MKTKTILSFILATLIALIAVNYAVASTGSLPISNVQVTVNDVEVSDGFTLSGAPEETVPVVIRFTADENLSDLKLKVWVEGYKADISTSTSRFDVVEGSTYIKRLSLILPSVNDMDVNPEGLTLYVRASTKEDYSEEAYSISMERTSYSVDLLSVDGPIAASAGDVLAYDIVLKNTGSREATDTFVTVSIPELGVSKKAYFGDLVAQDCDNDNSCNKVDTEERRVYLTLPTNVKSGDYTVQITASNYDTTATAKKLLSITGTASSDDEKDNGNVIKPTTEKKIPTSIIVLTVALVIIFVVLLIVLIVLLTKKPTEKSEDFGETSYY
jgi:uncharacterized repeat protein (TIGR01451 family)